MATDAAVKEVEEKCAAAQAKAVARTKEKIEKAANDQMKQAQNAYNKVGGAGYDYQDFTCIST